VRTIPSRNRTSVEIDPVSVTTETDITNPVIVSPNPATDPDGDGQLEDVDGDGEATFDDAITLAFNTDDASENRDSFDFDGDGDVDFDDAIALAFAV
jgi:PKD repeat protein